MYDISLNQQEIEYLKTIIAKKIDTYSGHESEMLESIQKNQTTQRMLMVTTMQLIINKGGDK